MTVWFVYYTRLVIMERQLGVFERAQLIADTYSPFHIAGVMRLENAPPPHALQGALSILQNRHPFLSAYLSHKNGRDYFAPLDDPSLPFIPGPRLNDEHWRQVTESELAGRIDRNGPLFRCTYLFDEENLHAEIIFTISHIIADATSTSHLLHELMTICASLLDGEPASPPKLSLTPPLESRFPPEFQGWKMSLRTLRYAFAQMMDEITFRFRTINKRTAQVPSELSAGHILSLQFAEDDIEPFAGRARKEGVTLNSALNAVLLRSVNRHLYAGEHLAMRTFSFADLRPYVQPPLPAENLGLYISMMRYSAIISGEMDFWSLARDLHKKIYTSLKSGDKFVAARMSESLLKMLARFKTIRTCASALNYNGASLIQTHYGNIKVRAVHGYVSAFGFGPEMASQAQIFNNQLFWDFVYMDADMSHETATAVMDDIKGIMKSAIKK